MTGLWRIVDERTGFPASVAAYLTEAGAENDIRAARHNYEHGYRPDLADIVYHLVARQG